MKCSLLVGLSLVVGWLFAGCGKQHHSSTELAETEPIPLFQEKKGILLPEEMKKAFGVEIVEVAERPMQRELCKLARVYRAACDGAPAAACVMLTTAETNNLKP